jgi:hypothetical protein
MASTIDEILARKKPVEVTLNVKMGDEDDKVDFVIRAVGRKAWKKLVDEYQPKPAQQDEYQARQRAAGIAERNVERLEYDPERFPAVCLAATFHDPALTIEEAQRLWDSEVFSDGELERIFAACMGINRIADGTVNWGKGSPETPDSETSSPSPEPSSDPSPSS